MSSKVMEERIGRAITGETNWDHRPLTKRQQEIYDFIKLFMETRGHPPTRAEICRGFEFASPNAAEQHLRAIEAKGHIRLIAGHSRGIQLATK